MAFTHKFQQVKRVFMVTGEDRRENDSEHSFQLALVYWYIVESAKLNYDLAKIIKYSLVHDLVETYAGDTYFYTSNRLEKTEKKEREEKAAERIINEFPELVEMTVLISNYENKEYKECWFVHAIDKMLPVLNIYLDKGKSWHLNKVSLEMIRTKDEKISTSSDAKCTWDKLMLILEKNKEKLFPKI